MLFQVRGRFPKKIWQSLIAFAIKRRAPPPLLMDMISLYFLPHFFLLLLNLTYMKWILHLVSVKNITLSPLIWYFSWLKIDILRLVRLLTAIVSPDKGHLNYNVYTI